MQGAVKFYFPLKMFKLRLIYLFICFMQINNIYICAMSRQSNYIIGRPNEFFEFGNKVPIHIETGGFMLCTSGRAEVFVDSKLYNVKSMDLIVALPYSHVQAIEVSDDFDGVLCGVDLEFIIKADIADKSHYITSVSANPCVSLNDTEMNKVLDIYSALLKDIENKSHPFYNEMLDAKLKIGLYEIVALFANAKPNVADYISRDKEILNNFLIQLYSYGKQRRDLGYYAETLSITQGHLSKVIKRTSSRSASEWISDFTIISIKTLLHNSDMNIAAIAVQMNFPNASFLTQYFKKRTGQTPKQYQMNLPKH